MVYEEEESVSVMTQLEFIKEVKTPNLPDDEYTWSVTLTYEGQTEPASAQDNFVVGKGKPMNTNLIIAASAGIVLILLLMFFYVKRRAKFREVISDIVQKFISRREAAQ